MPNESDALMQLDPLELSAQDLDAIIAYQRKARQAHQSGTRPRKGSQAEPIDLKALGLVKAEKPVNRRRVT